jgi:hypothetical protein
VISQLCLSGKALGLIVGPLPPVSHLVHEPHKPLRDSYLAIPPTLAVVAGINHTESNPTLLSLYHLSQNKSMALSKKEEPRDPPSRWQEERIRDISFQTQYVMS